VIAGSIRAARSAGIQQATIPIAAIITATPTNVVGSLGCTPNRSLQRRRLEPNVACVLAALMAATHPLHHGL